MTTQLQMMDYIRGRMNYVLKEAERRYGDLFIRPEGRFQIGFSRKEEWSCEKFDEILGIVAVGDENALNIIKSGTQFTITVRMIQDKVHKDGEPRKFVVEFSWEPTGVNPFKYMRENDRNYRYGGERNICNDDDSDDGF